MAIRRRACILRIVLIAGPLPLTCIGYALVKLGVTHADTGARSLYSAAVMALPISMIAGVLALPGLRGVLPIAKLLIALAYVPVFLLFLLLTGN